MNDGEEGRVLIRKNEIDWDEECQMRENVGFR